MSYHQVMLVGRATSDSKLVEVAGKKKFAAFSVAVNDFIGQSKKPETIFYDCLLFGKKQIEAADKHVKKGELLTIVGRPSLNVYINKSKEPKASVKVLVNDWYVSNPEKKKVGPTAN